MIKHRFIVRGADDFKIFAAIPCEKQVLTWKKWVRPPDWAALGGIFETALGSTGATQIAFADIALAMETAIHRVDDGFISSTARDSSSSEMVTELTDHLAWAISNADKALADCELLAEWVDIVKTRDDSLPFGTAVDIAAVQLGAPMDPHQTLTRLTDVYTYRQKESARARVVAENRERVSWAREHCQRVLHRLGEISAAVGVRPQLAQQVALLLSSDPLPDTPCPPGTPFAAYAIEFQGSIFSIVEGCAWVAARNLLKRFSKRSEDKAQRPGPDGVYPPTPSELWFKVDTVTLDKLSAEHTRGRHGISVADQDRLVEEMQTALLATDEEKRVVEIVTQMLVERGLNPKAPERIPVVEADPKHANQQREVERRDQQENRAPKVRTIKFHVSPPRYLREAAERIFASPSKHKRAHWVIGHWRNQAWGVQHKEHRQKWIKPHIRGLGEAGAVVARVAASDEEVAAIEPSSDAPPPPPPILH